MKTPKRIQPLIDEGLVDEVLRPLMSGKEASVYVVRCGTIFAAPKCIKTPASAALKRQCSIRKVVKYAAPDEPGLWKKARVMAVSRPKKAGKTLKSTLYTNWPMLVCGCLRPYGCFDGILLMELILDDEGDVAPRLNDIQLTAEQARRDHKTMMQDILRMLSVGLVHGDLSEFNVLQDPQGPVIIDLPQAVDAAANNNAQWMLERDVNNITQYYAQFAPELAATKYAKEIWALFEAGNLNPNAELTGEFAEAEQAADVGAVLDEINAAFAEMQERKERQQAANEPD